MRAYTRWWDYTHGFFADWDAVQFINGDVCDIRIDKLSERKGLRAIRCDREVQVFDRPKRFE